ncbi:alpha/beta hydrolase [Kribbella antibiotica]|uniref:Alpha/beta hydrolase n=1 Tax=Kribbella antibiotica TaxID=190195 RepID=A0A4R4Z1R5_9ACTN|nr:alpha/beta hydrolase [Kribbella antibiotica]TDD49982.1 alpha/beta hydrolase [Kribbella antibiotica]
MRKGRRRLLIGLIAAVVAIGSPFVVARLSLQPGAALVKTLFEAGAPVTTPPDFDAVRQSVTATRDITVTAADAPPAALDVYAPKASKGGRLPIILWIHGGGFISGGKESVGDYTMMLAAQGYVVASLDYTLAPAAQYPTPIRQANAALGYLATQAGTFGGDASRLFVGGDSAGGQLASQLAALVTNPALANDMPLKPAVPASSLRGALLFCGIYDMPGFAASGFPFVRTFMWSYLGRRDWLNYERINELSTVDQATAAYPPTLLTVGDKDPFDAMGREFVAALHGKGVPVTSTFYSGDGLNHEYQFNFALPQAVAFFQTTLGFLSEHSRAEVTS